MSGIHGANESVLFAQIFDPYEVTIREFAHIKDDLFAHVYKASRPRLHEQIKPSLVAQILDPYEVTPDKFEQKKHVLFAHVNAA